MSGVLVATHLSLALISLIGLASAQLTERIWRSRPGLAVPLAILGIGLAMWVQFTVTWLVPPAGPYLAHVVLGVSIVYCAAMRSWRLLSQSAPMALATVGIGLTYMGLTHLWRSDVAEFALASVRFTASRASMPVDNIIPTLLASRIAQGESTHALVGDWNGSDRPPLQSGWILLNDALFSRLGLEGDVLPLAAGVVAQLLWIPATYGLLRAIGVGRRPGLIAILFAAATGTILTNTIYTWPKLLSAALVCAAMTALIVAARRHGPPVPANALAAVLFALAMLAHGAAAFTLPAVGILGALTVRNDALRTKVLTVATAVATALAAYAPWILFQRFYDPPGDRLLKWHLAGVIPIDGRSLWEALVDSYSPISLADYLSARWANIRAIANLDLGVGLGSFAEAAIGERRAREFFDTSIALGLGVALLALMTGAFVLYRIRFGELPPGWRRMGGLVALMLPCIVLWSIVLFVGGSTVVHQGSHVWILILLAAPAAWVAVGRPTLAVVAWLTQLALMLAVYVPYFGVSTLKTSGLATLVSGLAILGGAAWWALPHADARTTEMA